MIRDVNCEMASYGWVYIVIWIKLVIWDKLSDEGDGIAVAGCKKRNNSTERGSDNCKLTD